MINDPETASDSSNDDISYINDQNSNNDVSILNNDISPISKNKENFPDMNCSVSLIFTENDDFDSIEGTIIYENDAQIKFRYEYYLRTTQSVSQSISSKVVSLNISLEWVWMICKLFSSNTGSSNNLANS